MRFAATNEYRLFSHAQIPSSRKFLSKAHSSQHGATYPGKWKNKSIQVFLAY